ncbi:DUF1269 domain-containing protein [Pedobacter duraquae]|uniref:Uncharacterized protein DUF1269 n=1 Tax=Pedobacter duraquae TaxID=425511 RepID=A0A4R6IQR2_9SPHI|nr:DUF1269 domain-containing protein [Pedobacter duraquae]TDO24366.1 uncharacterized protein DUF1269 [Pedobacter duraquae]
MEKMIQALFNTETDAFKGLQAIQQLGLTKDISIGETYVLTKDLDGNTAIRSAKDEAEGSGALGGGLIGGLIGLLAGPLGLIVGVAGGMLAGSAGETLRAESVSDYLDVVSEKIPNGKSVLVAHVWEDWETPLNSVLLPITTDVSRFNLQDDIYVPAQTELDKISADIKTAEIKFLEAEGNEKADWNETLEALRLKREQLQRKLNSNYDQQEKQYQLWINEHRSDSVSDEEVQERASKRLEAQKARLEQLKNSK